MKLVNEPSKSRHELFGKFKNEANDANADRDLLEDLDGYSFQLLDDDEPLGCCTVIVRPQDCSDSSTPGCDEARMLEDMFDQI